MSLGQLQDMGTGAWLLLALIGLVGVVVYFLPIIIVIIKGLQPAGVKHGCLAPAVNLLLGWTVLGWFAALMLALQELPTIVHDRGVIKLKIASSHVNKEAVEMLAKSLAAVVLNLLIGGVLYATDVRIVAIVFFTLSGFALTGFVVLLPFCLMILFKPTVPFKCAYCGVEGPITSRVPSLKCRRCGGMHFIEWTVDPPGQQ